MSSPSIITIRGSKKLSLGLQSKVVKMKQIAKEHNFGLSFKVQRQDTRRTRIFSKIRGTAFRAPKVICSQIRARNVAIHYHYY